MSEAADIPLAARAKFLAIGLIAGGALVYGIISKPPARTDPPKPAAPSPETVTENPPVASQNNTTSTAANTTGVGGIAAKPVVVVDGEAITLGDLEDALIKKEGVTELLNMLEKHFNATDWSTIKDDDIVVETATWGIKRAMLGAQLLKMKASDAREDLIQIRLVRQALKKAGVIIDDAAIAYEIKRMEKRHYAVLEARKQPHMEFKQFIEQTQKVSFDQYVQQDGFKLGVGVRILVEREAERELDDATLKAYLDAHVDRYRVQPAADISDIYIPYQVSKDANGQDVVTDEEKNRLHEVMQNLYLAISNRKVSFERTFQTFGRLYDQQADQNGRLGFVARDGTRPQKGARRVAQRVMDEAFAAQPPYPVLLPPIASETGMDLVLVHSRRAGKEPVLDELRQQLIADIVDSELKERTARLLTGLRRSAVIDYQSLPPLIEQRERQSGLPTEASSPSEPAPMP